jgi:CubicO group peptidase (beta-lactamase class C family)
MTRFRSCALLILLLALVPAAAGAQPAPFRGLDDYITRAMADWDVPGLGLAIVRNDSLVYARGYGVRELGSQQRVDEHTIFAIGSASKAFTAAGLAILVDEGRLSWDDPATKHLPYLQLHDPYATRELSIRDLLSHRSGLARGDRLWYATDLSREDIVRQVRHLEPSWSFRATFGYQNIMYIAAGEVSAALEGRSWDDVMQQRLFAPLGMRRTSTTVRALANDPNVATPHGRYDDVTTPIAWRNIDNAGAAGSINSSVFEMASWVQLQLNRGTFGGQRLISEGRMREMHSPHTIIAIDTAGERLYPETNFRSYGLGWFLEDYRGRKVVHHGGNIDGMSALVAMLPGESLGLIILTNANGSGLPMVLARRIFDHHLGGPGRDWSRDVLAFNRERQERAREQRERMEAERVADTTPSLPLERYAGTYEHVMYGSMTVAHEDGTLVLRGGPAHVTDLEHWHFDTFRARWRDRQLGQGFVTFALDASGEPVTMNVDGLAEFRRARAPAARANSGDG